MKQKYKSNLSCSVAASAVEPIDVWARAGFGTRSLVMLEEVGRHRYPAGEQLPPIEPK